MAIEQYSDLLTAIDNWMDRSDLTNREPEFIALFEAEFNRKVRTTDMVVRSDSFTVDDQYVSTPTDFLEARRMVLQTSPVVRLEYISPAEMSEKRETKTSAGKPLYYTIVGGNFEFWPSPDSAYTASLTYYQRIAALTASNTSNWLLESHPDIYLYGCLAEAEPFLKNDERLPVWKSLLDGKMEQLRRSDEKRRIGDSPRLPIKRLGRR